jgi:peptidoglycan/xylan/chitin deacetylase (PgdA/CDA1 family)
MLELFDQYKVPSTWCIPGHTIESFPEICEEVYAQGHGVQHHGWTHKGPSTYESKDTKNGTSNAVSSPSVISLA